VSEIAADEASSAAVCQILQRRVDAKDAEVAADLKSALSGLPLFPADRMTALGQAAGELLERHPEAAIQLGIELVASDEPTVRAFAVSMIARLSRFHPAIWKDIVRHSLTDDHWEIRQLAAHAFDSLPTADGAADFHFDFVLELVEEWVRHSDYLVRYAATQALLNHAAKQPEIGQRILGALDPLFNDPSDHVRSGALGALRAIGKRRPDLVFSFIELKLDAIGKFDRELYRHALDEPFAAKNSEWRDKLLRALDDAAPA
jgi:hypothetical protein